MKLLQELIDWLVTSLMRFSRFLEKWDHHIDTTPEDQSYPKVATDRLWREYHKQGDHGPYNRDSIWQTNRDELVRVRHLKDRHLANLIDFLRKSSPHQSW